MKILQTYQEVLLATLGAIQADAVLHSKESSKCIRDSAKHLESLGVELRRELILSDKTLAIKTEDTVA